MDQRQGAPEQALAWIDAGGRAAIATVIDTWGSAPRRVGAQMAISDSGDMSGSVSGGCVEGAVVVEALEALEDGQSRVLEYGVSDGDAFAVGLACGGTIRVLVEPVGSALPLDMLRDLVAARTARKPLAYVVALAGSARRFVWDGDGYEDNFRFDRSAVSEDGQEFIAIHNPPLRLVVVGAVHIAQALAPMAQIAGFDVTIIDPREAFGSQSRFPDAQLRNDWPDAALTDIGLDARTGVVLLTHDPKLDDPALHIALRSDVFYIGALGSKRTHASRIERLSAAGFGKDDTDRIHGPVGLNIGAAGPAEIAVAILAQMIDVLRG